MVVRWYSICRPRYQEKGGHYSPDKDCNERKQIALMILAMMHDLLYEQQTRLKPAVIPVWAKKIGLDLNKFGKDIKQGGVVEKHIQEDRQSGTRSGVNGTPTFYINGKRYDGSHDYDSLLAALALGATLRVKSADRVVPRIPKRTRRTTAYSEQRGEGND